jgi:FdhD protein
MATTRVMQVLRFADQGAPISCDDVVVAEEPLEIRVSGDAIATTLRTPGHDRELALGFLVAEGVIHSIDDVSGVAHCGRPGEAGWGNVIEVTPAPGARFDVDALGAARRGTLTTAACGVCGRRSIDDLIARAAPLTSMHRVACAVLASCVDAMRLRQRIFAATGGCHGASLFTLAGEHAVTHEDVGRHNAVDKVLGAMALARALPLTQHVLVVSGRAGFEIVQKAHAAGVAIVASVSAPSAMAVELAHAAGVTLVGFVRGASLVAYAHHERLHS